MADDSNDPDGMRRRHFLRALGAAGLYAAPAVAYLGRARPAFALGESRGEGGGLSEGGANGGAGRAPIYASADSFISKQHKDRNEGSNVLLRVGKHPTTRAVVQFDVDALAAALADPHVQSVMLVLTIAANHGGWGRHGAAVDALPLLERFVEGNARSYGLAGAQVVHGSGPGVTWHSPEDPHVDHPGPSRAVRRWHGALDRAGAATAPSVVHTNDSTGDVTWDVTADARAGATGWLVKLGREHRAPHASVDYHAEDCLPDAQGFDRGPHLAFVTVAGGLDDGGVRPGGPGL